MPVELAGITALLRVHRPPGLHFKMAFLGAPPLSGQVLGLWPDCCRDINVLLAGHPYYHACKGQKQYTLPDPCAIED